MIAKYLGTICECLFVFLCVGEFTKKKKKIKKIFKNSNGTFLKRKRGHMY